MTKLFLSFTEFNNSQNNIMNKLIFITIFFWISGTAKAQDDAPIGYKLKESSSIIHVFRNLSGKTRPDSSVANNWNYDYWFKLDTSNNGIYKGNNGIEYFRIVIESNSRFDDNQKKWVEEKNYATIVPWNAGETIDGSDFNTWLWIMKNDFVSHKIDYYGCKVHLGFMISGLTVPFKFHPPIKSHDVALVNGDVNLGTIIGIRIGIGNRVGMSIGGTLGITSLIQNSSTNTVLAGDTASEVSAGFNYGGQ